MTPQVQRNEAEDDDDEAGETTGLLSHHDSSDAREADEESEPFTKQKRRWRWPSIIALTTLLVIIIAIIIFAFIAPSVLREYAQQAAEIDTPRFALEEVSKDSVKIRVKVDGRLNADKVKGGFTRNIGRFATALGGRVSAGATTVSIISDSHKTLALVSLPPQALNIRNGKWNHLDVPSEIEPKDLEAIKKLAQDALRGDMEELALTGAANIPLKVRGISLGTHAFSEKVTFEGTSCPGYFGTDLLQTAFAILILVTQTLISRRYLPSRSSASISMRHGYLSLARQWLPMRPSSFSTNTPSIWSFRP